MTRRSALRAPRVEVPLKARQRVGQQHPRPRDDEEAHEDLGALERRAGDRHHPTYPMRGGNELADDDADECMADAQAEASQEERDRTRKCYRTEDREISRAERPRDPDQV